MSSGVNAGTVRAKLTMDNGEFRSSMDGARQDMQKLGNDTDSATKKTKSFEKALKIVGAASVAAIGASVTTAARFEQSMAQVKAISGATGEDFDALNEKAKALGASTVYSSSEVAQGMTYLAMAGYDATQIIDSMEGVLNLASAAQLDLGASADYVTNIMSAFGLEAKDSTHTVDVLVQAMSSANTDLTDLAEGMKYAGPLASSLGYSLEDTAAAMALLANYGIKGSQAGTSLRAALLSLANPTGQTAVAIEELGISVKNSEGEMKSLPELIDHINERMEGMTDTQKAQYTAMLVGSEASTAFISLLGEGGDAISEFTESLEKSDGAAAAYAETMMDTTVGACKEFLSALEGLGIQIGEVLLPVARKVVEAGTGIIGMLANLNPQVVAMGLTMATGASAAGLLVTSFMKIRKAAALLSLSTGPVGVVAVGIGALIGAFMTLSSEAEITTKSMEEINAAAKETSSLNDMANRFDELKSKMKLTSDEWAKYIDLNAELQTLTSAEEIAKVEDEMAKLAEKSGLSKDELSELVGVNSKLAEVVPDSTKEISEQNNVIVTSTDAVRELTAAKREQVLADLEIAKAAAEANKVDNQERLKSIQIEINAAKKESKNIEKEIESVQAEQLRVTEERNKAIENGDSISRQAADTELIKLDAKQKKLVENLSKVKENKEALIEEKSSIEDELALLEKFPDQYAQQLLALVGIKGSREESVTLVNNEIIANARALKQLEEKVAAGELTVEQAAELKEQYIEELGLLGETKELLAEKCELTDEQTQLTQHQADAIADVKAKLAEQGMYLDENTGKILTGAEAQAKITEEAAKTNEELAKDVEKTVTVDDNGTNEANHKEATKAGSKEVKTTDKGTNAKNDKEATKKGTKEVKTTDKGSNAKNHKEATKKGTKQVKTDDKGSNAKNHKEATKEGTKSVKAILANRESFFANFNPVSMTVNLVAKGAQAIKNAVSGKKHSGGTVHELPRPKYHTGGIVEAAAFDAPKFDEVDVRLLRNEMVLTQGQQANLFRMVSSFGELAEKQLSRAATVDNSTESKTVIQIGQMVVREEADITKISEELERLARQRQRSKGVY